MTSSLEKRLETRLTNWVKAEGGIALKGSTTFDTGFPDRIIFLRGAHAYVELKGTSARYLLTDKQKVWAGRIIAAGIAYYIVESYETLDKFKESVYDRVPPSMLKNTYSLNGFQLELRINTIKKTYEVFSHRKDKIHKILKGKAMPKVADTIYVALKRLEEKYPKTNYSDM